MLYPTNNQRILNIADVIAPATLSEKLPISETTSKTTYETRQAIHNILHSKDDRLLVIVGPCSIHDVNAAHEYARQLMVKKEELAKDLLIVMRVYFEKPRTTVGWKGLINDPDLDDTYQINKGLEMARQLLLDLNELGMPVGVEYLDLITPQYLADTVAWGAIGARTTESQVHRELASGLSCPVGFKNGTAGGVSIAVDAVRAASRPHHFLSLTAEGRSAIFATKGNEDSHIILRGGSKGPNYDATSINQAAEVLEGAGLDPKIMVDLSHANSSKQHERQMIVGREVGAQIAQGDHRIFGVMIESHLVGGRQDVKPNVSLVYGQSITDACLAWQDTAPLLDDLAAAVRARRG